MVINALYWEQLTQGELAVRLEISQQAISRRRQRAFRRIEEALNGGGRP